MEKKKIIPAELPSEVYRELEAIVGKDWITRDRAILETYSKLSIEGKTTLQKHMKDPTSLHACIVLPATVEEVQAVVRTANKYKVPFIPFTNGQMLCTPTNAKPTICIHLSRMNRVLSIDEDNMTASVEAYADYGQVLADAAKVGLWNGGTPLSTTLCKISSQAAFAGIWQTSKKYGLLDRNIISLTMVLPTGEIFKTGANAIAGVKDFWEYAPGPDLFSLVRGSLGTAGIIVEVTVKLHAWVGGADMPEPPAGRPCIQNFHKPEFDTAPPPDKHRLFWMEFPDYDSEINAFRAIAHSGIGIGLNATGVYNSYYCSQTQEMTEKRVKEKFFPDWNLYVISAGITSDRQIDYEKKVLDAIVAKHHGTYLSQSHKPEVLYALAPWNLDFTRHVTGYRMNRRNYAGGVFFGGAPEIAKHHTKIWKDALSIFGQTYMTDRGGADNTVFLYAVDPAARFNLTETDMYPDPMDVKALQKCMPFMLYGMARNISMKKLPIGFGISLEPMTSFFPEQGPNAYLFFRKIRKILDPNGVSSPGRQIFSEEEYNALAPLMTPLIDKMKKLVAMNPVLAKMLLGTASILGKIKTLTSRKTA
ncbi:MAG: FAD-binding oxidoreductase [Deltaproteobacteria bacterium]|nr:FAD-binding oxidoreductase [Deltaproteobacteria bacterium]